MRRWTIGIPKVLVVKSIVPLSKFLLLHSAQGPKIQPAPDGRWPPFGDGFFPNSLTATKLFEIQAGSLQKCARTFVVARISKFRKEIPSFEASPVFLYSKSSAYSQLVLVIEPRQPRQNNFSAVIDLTFIELESQLVRVV